VEIPRGVDYAGLKKRIEDKFGLGTLTLRFNSFDGQKPLYQDIHLKEALAECGRAKSRSLVLLVSREGYGSSVSAGANVPTTKKPSPATSSPAKGVTSPPRAVAPSTAPAPTAAGGNQCHACGKSIVGEGVRSPIGAFHTQCLTCCVCKVSLLNVGFNVNEGNLYCHAHHLELNQEKCDGCGQGISGKYADIEGQKYHPQCFVCVKCRKPFSGGTYTTSDGQPVHPSCLGF